MESEEGTIGYMCAIDFEHELGLAMGGNVVYPSVENLKLNHSCWHECGIVEVKVIFSKEIHKGEIE